MKDYKKVAEKILKMGRFCDIHNCGEPHEHMQVNLFCQLSEPYVIGYRFYVAFDGREWNIDYTLNPAVKMRSQMKKIRHIKTEKEMLLHLKEIIHEIRKQEGIFYIKLK